ncbi:MAG: hypothetical protein ACTTKN_00305 [Phocaeicola sp.]|uniref:hypothetical protein n=1 Tax=Phocaeicola sp. TaxID=2773926 RepID=UPI003F9F62B0
MNNKLLFLGFILFLSNIETSLSQAFDNIVKLSFEIKDANNHEPLSNVTCRVFTREGEFYTYSIADNKGRLSVSVHQDDYLEFSFIGYGKLKNKVTSYIPGRINLIELSEQEIQLREVTIIAPPISAKNDTLVYNIASFVKQGDSYLEDVLKKLPGIKVAENGIVSYQGKCINKFYIEGKDLLGSNYNQATRNMPIDAVTTVEILENHQPVKMLQGHQFTDKAALNIKLDKEHKLRPFGEIEGGIGCSPFIWQNRLFLTQILGKSQLLITGKMNNVGTDISDETKEHIDVTDIDAYESILPRMLSPFLNMETLPQNRYLYNKSYSLGANYLTSISKEATLRINVLFYEDCSSYSNHYDYTYGGTNSITINEINNKTHKTHAVLPILKYELNNSNAYISNELRYSFNRSSTSNTLVSNGMGITENINSRPYYLQNYLTTSFSIGKQIMQAKSFFRYFNRQEALTDISDSTSFYNIYERYATQSIVTKNQLSTSFQLGKNYLDLGTKVYYRDNLYDYKANVHHKKMQLRFLPSYTIIFGTERALSIEFPIEWIKIDLNSPQINNRNKGKHSLASNLYFKYELTDKWKFVLSASMNRDNITAEFYSPYTLRTAYRTAFIPNNEVFFNSSKSINTRLNYRNLATMFFANFLVSYTDEERENYANYNHTDSVTTISYIKGDNHHRLLVVDAAVDKNFIDVGITLKSGLSYNKRSYLLSQSGILTHNNSNIFAVNLNATYQKLKWLRATMGISGTVYWDKNNIYQSNVLSSLISKASVFIFPIKDMNIKLMYQSYTNEISKSNYKTCSIFDITANYKINKNWEIGSSISNLLNASNYTIMQNSGINNFRSYLPLRGQEFLFRILLKI